MQDWELAERPCRATLEAAIAGWCATGEWPELDDECRRLLRLRLNGAADFVFLLGESPLPAGWSEADALRWLLLEWWPAHGREFFARSVAAGVD